MSSTRLRLHVEKQCYPLCLQNDRYLLATSIVCHDLGHHARLYDSTGGTLAVISSLLSHILSLPFPPLPSSFQIESPTSVGPFGIPLYSYHEIPSFLKGNPYITDGYRAHLPPDLCVKRYRVTTSKVFFG